MIPILPADVLAIIFSYVLDSSSSLAERQFSFRNWSTASRQTYDAAISSGDLTILSCKQLVNYFLSQRTLKVRTLRIRLPPEDGEHTQDGVLAGRVIDGMDSKELHLSGATWQRGRALWESVQRPPMRLERLSLGDAMEGGEWESDVMLVPAIGTWKTIHKIAQLPKLRHLAMSLNWDDEEEPFIAPSEVQCRLESLHAPIWGGTRASVVLAPLLSAATATLKTLVLGGRNHAQPDELALLLRELQVLEELRIPHLRGHWLLRHGALARMNKLETLEVHATTIGLFYECVVSTARMTTLILRTVSSDSTIIIDGLMDQYAGEEETDGALALYVRWDGGSWESKWKKRTHNSSKNNV